MWNVTDKRLRYTMKNAIPLLTRCAGRVIFKSACGFSVYLFFSVGVSAHTRTAHAQPFIITRQDIYYNLTVTSRRRIRATSTHFRRSLPQVFRDLQRTRGELCKFPPFIRCSDDYRHFRDVKRHWRNSKLANVPRSNKRTAEGEQHLAGPSGSERALPITGSLPPVVL